MFGIGWAELLVIALVLVVVVKPEQLPEVARTLGRLYGQLQRLLYESRLTLERESRELRRAAEAPLERQTALDEPVDQAPADSEKGRPS